MSDVADLALKLVNTGNTSKAIGSVQTAKPHDRSSFGSVFKKKTVHVREEWGFEAMWEGSVVGTKRADEDNVFLSEVHKVNEFAHSVQV